MKGPAQLLALLVLLAAAACTTEDPTTTTNIPTVPTDPTVDTFTGSVGVMSTDVKPFTIALSGGTLTVALTALSQPIVEGIGVGVWDGTNCQLATNGTRNQTASPAPQLTFTQVPAQTYCFAVSDVGNQTGPVTYTVSVSHY